MKKLSKLFLCFAIAGISACSDSKQTAPKGGEIASYLPAQPLAFFTGDMQNGDLRSFIESPEYRAYLTGMRGSFEKNRQITGDFSTYWDFVSAIGILPSVDRQTFPYSSFMVFCIDGKDRPIDAAAYYDVAQGGDGRVLFAKAKEVLQRGKVTLEPVAGAGFDGIAIKFVDGGKEISPALAIYKDTFKVETVYLAASERRVAVSTDRALIDRAFAPATNDGQPFLASEGYKKALAVAGAGSSTPVLGVVDIPGVVRRMAAEPQHADILPLGLLGFSSSFKDKIMLVKTASVVVPKGPDQERAARVLAAKNGAATLDGVANTAALGVSVDGGIIKRAIDEFGGEIPAEGKQMATTLLAKISSLNIGLAPSSGTSPFPDLAITFASGDPDGLLTALKGVRTQLPLPPTMVWKEGTVGSQSVESLPTPLGIKIHMAKYAKGVVIATGDDALTSAVSGAALATTRGPQALMGAFQAPLTFVFIDYPKFAEMMKAGVQAASMFAPQGADLSALPLDQLSYMGRIGLSATFDGNVAAVGFSQDFSK